MPVTFKYDVAISFAEEDRNAALAMALALELAGFKQVYYYPNYRATGIGLQIKDKLINTYSKEARYVVLFLSKAYFREDKVYTNIELQAIKQRILDSPDIQYVVPVLIDEGLDISEDKVLNEREYIKWEYDPKEIARILKENFGQAYPTEKRAKRSGDIYIKQFNSTSGGGDQTNSITNLVIN